jgi:phage terminase Nu1 subunit (DNA packaging protein)
MAAQTFPLDTICKLLDLTPQRVNQLVREGIVPRSERGRYELVPVVQAYVRYLRDRAVKGDVHGDDYSAHRTRLVKVRADLLEMEQSQAEGRLIPAGDVEAAWVEVLANCRAKMLSIPTKAAPEVFAAESLVEVKGLLKTAVNEALSELASVNVQVKNPVRSSEFGLSDPELAGGTPTTS